MADLKLSDNNDLELVDGKLSFVTGREARAQSIKMALQTWLGECGTVYNEDAGVPYLQIIFNPNEPATPDAVRLILTERILALPGVQGVQLAAVFDNATGELTVTGTAQADEGEIDFTAGVSP